MIRWVIVVTTLFALFVTVRFDVPAWYVTAAEQVAAAGPDGKSQAPEFKRSGVCARCHVVSVLEWGFSGHRESPADCKGCHGPSLAHVADERNEARPDHFHQGPAIAEQTCLRCHESGCEKTLERQSCEKCHHVHALIDPSKPPQLKDDRLAKLLARRQRFDERMTEGDRQVERRQWKAAQEAFRTALELIPGNHRARLRLEMCSRRLRPELPGFAITGDKFNAATGLPRKVAVAGLGTLMLLVPPGEFEMGSDDLVDSQPVHTVRVDAFYLGRCEVTQAEWNSVMGDNPSAHQGEGYANAGRMPGERVSWNDCQEFLQRLNKRVPGGEFRLPTEAEWEYACRAGSGCLGEKELAEHAWFDANSLREPEPRGSFLQVDAYAPRPAGTRKPNAWGFLDMQGNVREWCSSLSRPYLYRADDGRESLTVAGLRVVRGGSYADSIRSLDPALRHTDRPHRRMRFNGLRLARNVPSLNLEDASAEKTAGLGTGLTTRANAEVRLTIKEVTSIRPTHDGRYFGRASLRVLANGVWVMTYIHSDHHWKCHDGQIEVMFSADEGRTWAPPNTYLDGKPVSGLPSAASPKESPHDPIEPYIYLAPNKDLVIATMDAIFPGQGKPRPGHGGIWTIVSADDGRSWSEWSKVTFRGVPGGGFGDLTQDSFLDGNTIYATSRLGDWRENKSGGTLPGLFKSTDNGRTWDFVSCCDSEMDWDRTADSETGIERVGETELVVVIRGGFKTELPWLTRSQDMGKTWSKPVNADPKVKSWKRARIYTLKHLTHLSGVENIPEWWHDRILVGTGVHQVSVQTRNVGLWYSEDKGKTWSAPLDLDETTQDAGYGDVRMRKNGDLVVVSYHGAHDQASIKQYVVGIEPHKGS